MRHVESYESFLSEGKKFTYHENVWRWKLSLQSHKNSDNLSSQMSRNPMKQHPSTLPSIRAHENEK